MPSVTKKPWKTVFFAPSALALLCSHREPPTGASVDGEVVTSFSPLLSLLSRFSSSCAESAIALDKYAKLAVSSISRAVVAAGGCAHHNKGPALSAGKRPFSRAFSGVKGPRSGADRGERSLLPAPPLGTKPSGGVILNRYFSEGSRPLPGVPGCCERRPRQAPRRRRISHCFLVVFHGFCGRQIDRCS